MPRHSLKHFEPIRIFVSAGPWTLGPWFGIYLQRTVSFAAPFAVAGTAAALLLILFWSLRRKRQPDDTLRLTGDSGETGATE